MRSPRYRGPSCAGCAGPTLPLNAGGFRLCRGCGNRQIACACPRPPKRFTVVDGYVLNDQGRSV